MRLPLVNRDFDRLWAGQAVSVVGDVVFDTTLMIWIARDLLAGSRWAPAAASGLMLCAFLAIMVVGPAAGVFVDRWRHRTVMLASETIRGILVAGLCLLTLVPVDRLPVWLWLTVAYTVVLVLNSAEQFFNPARFATIGEVVPGEADRGKAFGLSQATNAAAVIVGPPLAAPLLIATGIQWALLLNALSYAVSYLAIRSVRFPTPEPAVPDEATSDEATTTWRAEFAAGVRVFRRSRFLVALLTASCVAALGAGSITALNIFFLTDNLHVDSKLLGIVSMALGIGTIIGALVAGKLVARIGARKLTWLGMVAGGTLFGLYARQTSLVPAMVLAAAFMIPVAAFNTALSPLILAAAPKAYIGRVMAVFGPVNTAAAMLSVVLAGWLASTKLRSFHATFAGVHVGPIDFLFTVSALLIVAAGLYASATLPKTTPAPDPAIPVGEDVHSATP